VIVVLGILLALAVFLAVVIIHELGHFLAARSSGVRVEEFGVGIPPKAAVIARDRSGTEYTLNWLPIGGFVRMLGEDDDGSPVPGSFAAASLPRKLFITVAGVAMNFFLAFVIFWVLFMVGARPIGVNSEFPTDVESKLVPTLEQALDAGFVKADGIVLAPVADGVSTARDAGVLAGDKLLSVDGVAVSSPDEAVKLIRSGHGSVRLEISRSEGHAIIPLIVPLAEGRIGASVGYADLSLDESFEYRSAPGEAAVMAARETWAQIRLTFSLLGTLARNIVAPAMPEDRTHAVESLTGPIGVGNLFVNLVSVSVPVSVIFIVMALLSVNLGVFNILPIPALDGGRAALLVLRAGVERVFPASSGVGAVVE
jgi:regulator of sigma E protease